MTALWRVEQYSRGWHIRNRDTGELWRTAPCNYAPLGRSYTFRSELAALRRAHQLNETAE